MVTYSSPPVASPFILCAEKCVGTNLALAEFMSLQDVLMISGRSGETRGAEQRDGGCRASRKWRRPLGAAATP